MAAARDPNLDAKIEAQIANYDEYLREYPTLNGAPVTQGKREQARDAFVALNRQHIDVRNQYMDRPAPDDDDYAEDDRLRGLFQNMLNKRRDVDFRVNEYVAAPIAEGGRRRKTRKTRKLSKKRRTTRRK